MIFEQDKYYKCMQQLERFVNYFYSILAIIGAIIGYAITLGNGKGFIIGAIIGILIARHYIVGIKIKIQEMRWRMDIYNKLIK